MITFVLDRCDVSVSTPLEKLLKKYVNDGLIKSSDYQILTLTKNQYFQTLPLVKKRRKKFRETLNKRLEGTSVIIGMGTPVARTLFSVETDLGKHRGIWQEYEGIPTILTFSPETEAKWITSWNVTVQDIENAITLYLIGGELPKPSMIFLDTPERAVEYIESITDSKDPVVFDLETTNLSPYRKTVYDDFDHRIITMAFCSNSEEAYFLPLDHKDSPLKDSKLVKGALRRLFASSTPFIAHNLKFDMRWVHRCLGVWVGNPYFDTIAAAYLLNENHYGKNSLKELARDYTYWGGYEKRTLSDRGVKTYEDFNLNQELFIYNCYDVLCTFILYERFLPRLKEENLMALFSRQYMQVIPTFAKMEQIGQEIDHSYLYKTYDWYVNKLAEVESDLYAQPEVQLAAIQGISETICGVTKTYLEWFDEFEGLDLLSAIKDAESDYELVMEKAKELRKTRDKIKRAIAKDKESSKADQERLTTIITEIDEITEERKELGRDIRMLKGVMRILDGDVPNMNLNSTQQLSVLLYDVLKLDPPERKKKLKSGAKPTDKAALSLLSKESEIIEKIMTHRKVAKPMADIKSYIEKYSNTIDRRVHAEYNLTAVRTGRTSSSNPNAQNLPSEEGLAKAGLPGIKRCVISRFSDGFIVQADYSQLELRILAMYSKDPNLVKFFKEGHDLHTATSAMIFDKEIGEVTKLERKVGKTINFGVVYEIGAPKMAENLGCSIEQAEEYQKKYFDKFPKVLKYRKDAHKEARKYGYVTSRSGRRRRFPELVRFNKKWGYDYQKDFTTKTVPMLGIKGYLCLHGGEELQLNAGRMLRQGGNAKIQGQGSDFTLLSIALIQKEFEKAGLKSIVINSVHDSIVLDCPKDELFHACTVAKSVMEQVVPSLFGKFVNVPLVSDFEIGRNYGTLHAVHNLVELKDEEFLEKVG